MDHHHAKAVRLAVEKIDRNRDIYDDIDEQRAMLDRLISKHELKATKRQNWGPATEIDLPVDKFRGWIGDLANKSSAASSKKSSKIEQLFLKGSLILQDDLLDKIGYEKREEKRRGTLTESRVESVDVQASSLKPSKAVAQGLPGSSARSPPEEQTEGTPNKPKVPLKSSSVSGEASLPDRSLHSDLSVVKTCGANVEPDAQLQDPQVSSEKSGLGGAIQGVGEFVAVPKRKAISDPADTDRQSKRPKSEHDHARQLRDQIQHPAPVDRGGSPRLISIVPELVEAVDGASIQAKLRSYKHHAEQFAWDILEGISVDFSRPAEVVLNPCKELKFLYQQVFGEEWKEQSFLLRQTEFTAADLLKALLCAALYNFAFVQDLPWTSPDKAAETLRDFQPELDFNIKLICNRNPTPTFRNLLWNTRKCQFENGRFLKEEIVPHARDLAQSFMHTISSQLEVLGASETGNAEQRDQFWRDMTAKAAEAFQNAIRLRGQMKASRYYYEHKWVYSGDPVSCEFMEDTHHSGEPNNVRFCFWPAIWVKATRDSEHELGTKAMVMGRKDRSRVADAGAAITID